MPDVERIQQLTPGSLSQQWYEDGTAVDPGTVTVGITRADGTVLVAAGTATTGSGSGPRTFNLTTTHTALLDRLTVTWTSTLKGVQVSYIEVVGGFVFTIADARNAIGDQAYSAAKIADARLYAETELEGAVGFALVPRYTYATLNADRCMPLRLKPYTTVIRSATSNGTTLSSGDLAGLAYSAGFVTGYRWSGTVVVGYEHGLQTASPGAKRAALALALDYLDSGSSSSVDPRASSIVTVDGTINLRVGGGQFLAAGVNEWIDANRLPAIA